MTITPQLVAGVDRALVHVGANKMLCNPSSHWLRREGGEGWGWGGGRGVECSPPPARSLRGKEAARGESHWDGKTRGEGQGEG